MAIKGGKASNPDTITAAMNQLTLKEAATTEGQMFGAAAAASS